MKKKIALFILLFLGISPMKAEAKDVMCTYSPAQGKYDGNQFSYRYFEKDELIEDDGGNDEYVNRRKQLQIYARTKKNGVHWEIVGATGISPLADNLNWHNQASYSITKTNLKPGIYRDADNNLIKCPPYAKIEASSNDPQDLMDNSDGSIYISYTKEYLTSDGKYAGGTGIIHSITFQEAEEGATHMLIDEVEEDRIPNIVENPDNPNEIDDKTDWLIECTYTWPDGATTSDDEYYSMTYKIKPKTVTSDIDFSNEIYFYDNGSKFRGETIAKHAFSPEVNKQDAVSYFNLRQGCLELKPDIARYITDKSALYWTFNDGFYWSASQAVQEVVDKRDDKTDANVNVDFDFDTTKGCESYLGNPDNNILKPPAYYLQFAFSLMKYIAIAILLVMSIVEFAKATTSNNQDAMKKAIQNTIKRLIIAIVIFLLPMLIEFLFRLLGIYSASTCGIS